MPSLRVIDTGSTAALAPVTEEPIASRHGARVPIKRLAFLYHSLPIELRLRVAPVRPQVVATAVSHARLQAGLVELLTRISYRIGDAPLERLRIGLDEGLIVLGVSGRDIRMWRTEGDVLEVRLSRPVSGDYELAVNCVQHLRKVDGVLIPHVRALDAERESGAVGVSAVDEVALLHHHSTKFVQVDVEELPGWVKALGPKLAYVYDQPGGVLAVESSLIKPVLHVRGYATANVGEGVVEEECVFVADVERRPVFGFRLRIPAGLTPISLLGEDVADWEFRPARRALSVSLKQGLVGRTRLHVFCERRCGLDVASIPLGGVAVLDADDVSGWLGVGTDANLELAPAAVEGMIPMDIKDVPPLVAAAGNLRLAYRWAGEEWRMGCVTRPVRPRLEVETRTRLLFGTGRMQARTEIVCNIAKATLEELLIALPPGAVNPQIRGENIRSRELTDGLWRIGLARPVTGEWRLRVSFEQVADPRTGDLRFAGVRLPQAERQAGVIGVYLEDPQVEVSVLNADGAARTQTAPDVDGGAHAFLDAYRYSDPARTIDFKMKGHAMVRGVQLSAEKCSIVTVVKERGQAVNYMTCSVKNVGAQFFRMRLPQGADLWGAYVQGKPVRPNRLPDGDILIPLLEAPRGKPFDLAVIWAEPTGRLGLGGSLALVGPELGQPAEEVDWEVNLPERYQLVRARGNMRLEQRKAWYREGLPGILWQHVRRAWPVVKIVLLVAAGLVGIALLYIIARALRRHMARARAVWKEAAPEAEAKRRPILGGAVGVLIIVFIVAVFAAMLMPALSTARHEAREASAMSNLRQTGLGMLMYANDHGDKLPPSLDVLIEEGYLTRNAPVSPMTGERFIYDPTVELTGDLARKTMAWDRRDPKADGQAVLFADGHVEWVKAERGAKALRGVPLGGVEGWREDIGVTASGGVSVDAFPGYENDADIDGAGRPDRLEGSGPEADLDLSGPAASAEDEEGAKRIHSYNKALQLADSYRKRGEYRKAEGQYRRAQRLAPDDTRAKQGLSRLEELQTIAEDGGKAKMAAKPPVSGMRPPAPQAPPAKPKPRWETYSVGSLIAQAGQLEEAEGADWEDDVAETGTERGILGLVSGEIKNFDFADGGRAVLEGGDLVITGHAEVIDEVKRSAAGLRGRMLERTRQITVKKLQQKAESAAKRRAALRDMARASQLKTRVGGGTIVGNRAAGALPIEIDFPRVGTRPYPFHMDFAGTSVARIELTCLRVGTALTVQGLIGIAALALIALTGWHRPRAGLALAVGLVLLSSFVLKTGGEAPKPYAVMALLGACFAVLVPLTRLLAVARQRAWNAMGNTNRGTQ